jgi:hypothetical protein
VKRPQTDPPPPLIAQYRSEFEEEFTVKIVPLAFIKVASKILSTPTPFPGAKGP